MAAFIPKGVRGRQRQGFVLMNQAIRDAGSAVTDDCSNALRFLVHAAQEMGGGDRLVQPMDPDKQPAVLKEYHRLHGEFRKLELRIIDRCAIKKR